MTLLLFGFGLVALLAGAEMMVRGASQMAILLGLSPLVIGLTVVAFGTGTPELAISLQAAADGRADLAIGNVVGSNISNVLLILGVSALIAPLAVHQRLVRIDVPIMVGASLLLWLLAADGRLSPGDGALLAGGAVAYTFLVIVLARRETLQHKENTAIPCRQGAWRAVLLALAGLAGLLIGARWVVQAATEIARLLEVSELVIGLTVVAIGTSLPELATSVVAGLRGERDLAIGNVIGSNLYNILATLGLSSLVAANGLPVAHALQVFDLPFMIATAVACLPIFFIGRRISRWEGGLFFAYYIAYTAYLVLDAAGHDALPAFSRAMFGFVVPLTGATLAVLAWREWRLLQRRT